MLRSKQTSTILHVCDCSSGFHKLQARAVWWVVLSALCSNINPKKCSILSIPAPSAGLWAWESSYIDLCLIRALSSFSDKNTRYSFMCLFFWLSILNSSDSFPSLCGWSSSPVFRTDLFCKIRLTVVWNTETKRPCVCLKVTEISVYALPLCVCCILSLETCGSVPCLVTWLAPPPAGVKGQAGVWFGTVILLEIWMDHTRAHTHWTKRRFWIQTHLSFFSQKNEGFFFSGWSQGFMSSLTVFIDFKLNLLFIYLFSLSELIKIS